MDIYEKLAKIMSCSPEYIRILEAMIDKQVEVKERNDEEIKQFREKILRRVKELISDVPLNGTEMRWRITWRFQEEGLPNTRSCMSDLIVIDFIVFTHEKKEEVIGMTVLQPDIQIIKRGIDVKPILREIIDEGWNDFELFYST